MSGFVGVAVNVCVGVDVCVRVSVAVGVLVGAAKRGVEQPARNTMEIMMMNVTTLFITPLLGAMYVGRVSRSVPPKIVTLR